MNLSIPDFDLYISEQAERSAHFPRPGWYWQETRLPPAGPFETVGEALRHLTSKIETGELRSSIDAKSAARRS